MHDIFFVVLLLGSDRFTFSATLKKTPINNGYNYMNTTSTFIIIDSNSLPSKGTLLHNISQNL
jgi:hypothetical protein